MRIWEWTIRISSTKAQASEDTDIEDREMGMGMETSTGTIRGGDEVSEGGGRKMGNMRVNQQ